MKKNDSFDVHSVTRRRTLQVLGTGVLVPAALAACTESKAPSSAPPKKAEPAKKQPAAAASKPAAAAAASKPAGTATAKKGCDAEIDATSQNLRKTLQYVEKSKIEGKMCSNCAQWIKPEGDNHCGGCKLFTGPVYPAGYCLSWAKAQG
ncbi:MAG: high-potential iron-sulfur protein [Myxococcota bacterium]